MNRASNPFLFGLLALLAGASPLYVGLADMALAQTAKPGEKIPQEMLLPKDLPDKIGDKKKLLEDLYKQLRETTEAEDAKVVTSAIERLWLRSGSDTVDLLMARTAKLLEDEKYDLALNILDSIIELAPDYAEGGTRRAAVVFAKKEFGQSLENLRHALAIDPSHYKAIQGLGLLMQELGEKEAALKAFRRLLKVHPHLEEALQAVKDLSRDVEGQGI